MLGYFLKKKYSKAIGNFEKVIPKLKMRKNRKNDTPQFQFYKKKMEAKK